MESATESETSSSDDDAEVNDVGEEFDDVGEEFGDAQENLDVAIQEIENVGNLDDQVILPNVDMNNVPNHADIDVDIPDIHIDQTAAIEETGNFDLFDEEDSDSLADFADASAELPSPDDEEEINEEFSSDHEHDNIYLTLHSNDQKTNVGKSSMLFRKWL